MREYVIEEAGDPERLAELVKLRLRDGWQLQGGVSMVRYTVTDHDGSTESRWWYAQALVRHPEVR